MFSRSHLLLTTISQRNCLFLDLLHISNRVLHRNRENYIHRIGRSGRFGRKGVAINVRCIHFSSWLTSHIKFS